MWKGTRWGARDLHWICHEEVIPFRSSKRFSWTSNTSNIFSRNKSTSLIKSITCRKKKKSNHGHTRVHNRNVNLSKTWRLCSKQKLNPSSVRFLSEPKWQSKYLVGFVVWCFTFFWEGSFCFAIAWLEYFLYSLFVYLCTLRIWVTIFEGVMKIH